MKAIKLGMFCPHLHPPSKTKILIVLIQEITANSKFQVGGLKKPKNKQTNKTTTQKNKQNKNNTKTPTTTVF